MDDDIYYAFGDYIYNLVQMKIPKINGDLDIFKYVLGKIYLDYIFNED